MIEYAYLTDKYGDTYADYDNDDVITALNTSNVDAIETAFSKALADGLAEEALELRENSFTREFTVTVAKENGDEFDLGTLTIEITFGDYLPPVNATQYVYFADVKFVEKGKPNPLVLLLDEAGNEVGSDNGELLQGVLNSDTHVIARELGRVLWMELPDEVRYSPFQQIIRTDIHLLRDGVSEYRCTHVARISATGWSASVEHKEEVA